MKKVGRPRKAQRKENISVNLPKYLIDEINDELSWSSSRSKWIQNAIEDKLGRYGTYVSDAPTKQLMRALVYGREDVSDFIKVALQRELDKIERQEINDLEEKVGWKS